MYKSQYYLSQRRIPGIAVVLGAVLVIATVAFSFHARAPKPKLTAHPQIQRVDIANVRDTSITVFWRTEKPTRGSLMYGTSQEDMTSIAYDERDTESAQEPRHNHIVQMKGLKPQTAVYFHIVVDGVEVGQAQNLAYSSKTARPIRSNSKSEPLYGDIIRSNGVAEKDAIVLLTIDDSIPLLTKTTRSGTFVFSLCCLLQAKTADTMTPSAKDSVTLSIIAEDGTTKDEQGLFSDLNPLKEALVLDTQISQLASASTKQQIGTVLSATDIVKRIQPVDLIYPRQGAFIPGTQPLVRGVGEPGSVVKGTFASMGRLFQVTIDEKRNWLYQPSFEFTPGEHTLEVQTTDVEGQGISFTRSFTILKSGEAVLGEATPSGTLTPAISVTATPSATVIITPTEAVSTSSATPPPPISGTSIFPLTILSLVLVVIGAGIILVL